MEINRNFFGIVSSLCADDHILFAGKGNFFYCFDGNNDVLLYKKKVFDHNKITKIRVFGIADKKIIILLGETEAKFAFYTASSVRLPEQLNFISVKTHSGDFILDSIAKSTENKLLLALGFINNYIEIFEIVKDNTTYIKTIFSPAKCIVYSITFYDDADKLLVASGTVFRKIVIWEVEYQTLEKNNNSLILNGHEGVIFSVNFIDNQRLISTSDDRTSRFWIFDMKANQVKKSHAFFGHSSRVWDTALNKSKKVFVSVSEDATGRVCDFEKDKFLYELRNGHLGKNCRSAAINDNFIWTGGEDGQIIKWKLSLEDNEKKEDKKESSVNKITKFVLDKNTEQCVKAKEKQKNFTPAIKVVKFKDENSVLIGTNHGQVLLYSIKEEKIVMTYFNDEETRVINSIEILFNKFLIIGICDGNIQLVNIDNENESNTIKVFYNIRIPFISHKYFKKTKELFIIISTALGASKLYYIKTSESDLTYETLYQTLLYKNWRFCELITGSRYPIGVSTFEVVRLKQNNFFMVYLGDYEGRVYYTKLKEISSKLYRYNHDIKCRQIHSGRLTKIYYSTNQEILYTFGRDGKIRKFFQLYSEGFRFTIKEVDEKFRNDINSLEMFLYHDAAEFENGNYFIVGHHGRNLLIYNTQTNLIIHTNDVKGVNRSLDSLFLDPDIIYAYSQANALYTVTVSTDLENSKKNTKGYLCSYSVPIHGRLIHHCEIICIDKEKKIFLFCTAGEDTKVNFFIGDNNAFTSKDLKFVGQFTRHECAVRKCRVVESIKDSHGKIIEIIFVSIASKGEMYLFKTIINHEKMLCDINLLHNFTASNSINNKDIENTRNMDIAVTNKNKIFSLTVTNTCSIINNYKFVFDDSYQNINIISNFSEKNETTNFVALSINSLENYFFYGQTNGLIYIASEGFGKYYKVHEGGINDIKLIKRNNKCLIFSCGEDCSIRISEFDMEKNDLNCLVVERGYHFSAIKSIVIKEIKENKILVMSGSYDQSITIALYNTEENKLDKIKKIRTCVSEINSISSTLENGSSFICCGGQGLEIFEVKFMEINF